MGYDFTIPTHQILRSYLESQRPRYDYILLDSGPSLNNTMLNVLTAADSFIIPTEAKMFGAVGIGQLLSTIKEIHDKRVNSHLKVEGILFSMVDNRVALTGQARDLVERSYRDAGIPVFKTEIPISAKTAETTGTASHSHSGTDHAGTGVHSNPHSGYPPLLPQRCQPGADGRTYFSAFTGGIHQAKGRTKPLGE